MLDAVSDVMGVLSVSPSLANCEQVGSLFAIPYNSRSSHLKSQNNRGQALLRRSSVPNVSMGELCSGTETFHNHAAQITQRDDESGCEGAVRLAVGNENIAHGNAPADRWPNRFAY